MVSSCLNLVESVIHLNTTSFVYRELNNLHPEQADNPI